MKRYLIAAIFLLALFLRLYKLGSLPPSLTWDEAAWGYNAYSLGIDLKDEFGRLLPFDYLESFGDFKPPVYAYLAILPVKIFGLNEFATRMPAAFFGALTVLVVYFLVKELFKKHDQKEALALITGLLLAFSPWHIMLSRAAFEANVASFFIIFGVFAFIRGVREGLPAGRQGFFLVLSLLSFVFSLMTFNTARVFVPLFVLVLLVYFRKEIWQKRRSVLLGAVLSFACLLPTLIFLTTPQSRLRFAEVNIFADVGIVEIANQQIANDQGAWWSKIIHNRRIGYVRSFLNHYFDHFDPAFLFISGDGNPKFSTQTTGQLYLVSMPFLIFGFLLLLKTKPEIFWLLLGWLLLGVIPAATARETPHALRIETVLPTFQIFTAFGIVGCYNWLKKKLFKKAFVVLALSLYLFNFIYFAHFYLTHYSREFSGEWQYGYRQAIDFINHNSDEYDRIYFTNELGRPYIYFLFYLKKDPDWFRQKAVVEREALGFVTVESVDKYYFVDDFNDDRTTGRALYINLSNEVPDSANILKDFYLLSGEKVLTAYEL